MKDNSIYKWRKYVKTCIIDNIQKKGKIMKRRLLTLLLVLGMSVALMSGCGRSSEEKPEEKSPAEETTGQTEENNEEEDAKEKEKEELTGWVTEAVEKHAQANLWGADSHTIEVDVNGGEKETVKSVKTMDTEKQIIMFLYHFETNDQTTFWAKEGDKLYRYEESFSENADQSFLKILCGEKEAAYYEAEAKGAILPFESSPTKEMAGYDITNEGEDGDTVKIKVVEQYKLKTEEFFNEMTRESVLKDYGWTEDDMKRVEGASEAVDAYVAENEANIAKNKEHVYEEIYYYWLTKEGHELVKSECRQQPTIMEYDAQKKFFAMKAKMEGYTIENDEEEDAETKEYIITTEYVTGDKCTPIENFPKDAKEVTMEQWMNGEY